MRRMRASSGLKDVGKRVWGDGPVNASVVVDKQGPSRLVHAKKRLSTLWRLQATAEAGAGKADGRKALG